MRKQRQIAMAVPPNVYWTVAKGKRYFFHQIGRGTAKAGPVTRLGSDERALWDTYRAKVSEPALPALVTSGDTFRAMVEAFRASPKWESYRGNTPRAYNHYLDKMVEVWGDLKSWEISPAAVLAFRDSMGGSPGGAHAMVTIGKTVCKWAVPRNWMPINPFREIEPLPTDDDGHWPWPDWAVDYVIDHAPADLARLVYLGVEIGQRESDLLRMGPFNVERRDSKTGLWVRPIKTAAKRRAFWVPLRAQAALTVERWQAEPLTFYGGRWGHTVTIPPGATFILSPAGAIYTPEGLRSRWNRWLAKDAGKAFLDRWAAHETALRTRDCMDIPDVMRPTIHGLRSTAVVRRRRAGYSDGQVSNDIGMSIQMVKRYSRFMDQQEAAVGNIVMLEARK